MDLITRHSTDEKAWKRLSEHPYELSARSYFNRSYNLYPRTEEDNSLLFYCALELRCAIEKVFYEYLSNIRRDSLSQTEDKLWSAKNLKSAILTIEPDFVAKLDFLNLLHEIEGAEKFAIPDVDRLSRDYGRLNGYLHAQKAATADVLNIDWWANFRALIVELHNYAWPCCAQARVRVELNNFANDIFNDFKAGRKTRAEIVKMLKPYPEEFEVKTNYRFYLD